MQAHAELHHNLAARCSRHVELCDARAHCECGARRGQSAVRRIAHCPEDRHDPVSGELVEDAAVVEDAPRHDAEIRVDRGDRLLRGEPFGKRGRPTEIGEEDRHGLPLSFEPQGITLDDTLDDGRRKKALEAATAIELEDKCAHRQNDRHEHEPVVFPPRRRPDRSEELRDLRLRKQRVRDGERTLKWQAGANEVATLRERGVAVEDEDRGDDREGDPAGTARGVAAHG